jgi:hypothetical protein
MFHITTQAMFRLNAYPFACFNCMPTQDVFLLLPATSSPWYLASVQLRSLCLEVCGSAGCGSSSGGTASGGHSRGSCICSHSTCKPALRHCGWKVYLSEADTRRWQRTPEAIARLRSDSEPGPWKAEAKSRAVAKAVATAVAVTLSEVFWRKGRWNVHCVRQRGAFPINFPSTSAVCLHADVAIVVRRCL